MRLLRYALSICALMPLMASAGHGAPLAVPAPFAAPATLDQTATSAAIKAGVSACHWQASFERRGYVEALLQDKSLLIRVGLLYDPKQIRMVYLESKGFHYQIDENGTVIVHKKLNYWLARLDSCLRTSLNVVVVPTSTKPDDAVTEDPK